MNAFNTNTQMQETRTVNVSKPPPPPSNPGGIFCHYWLLCERGMQECSIRCPEASAGRASKRCVLLAITAH